MKKLFVAGALLASLGVAHAVSITVDGTTYQLQSMNVQGDGNITVTTTGTAQAPVTTGSVAVNISGTGSVTSEPAGINCSSGTGTCSYSFTQGSQVVLRSTIAATSWSGCTPSADNLSCTISSVTSSQQVSATFPTTTTPPAPTSPDGCPAVDSNLVIVKDLGLLNKGFSTVKYDLGKNQIMSFKLSTVAELRKGAFNIAYTTTNPATKIITVSTCPGDVNVSALPAACVAQGYETAKARYSTYEPPLSYECNLDPNKTYYVNVKSATKADPNTSTCSATNCPFFFSIN